jgi:hypothetical protein
MWLNWIHTLPKAAVGKSFKGRVCFLKNEGVKENFSAKGLKVEEKPAS